MVQVSAVIIASNEDRNIVRCVKSLRLVADEILVYLNNSQDGTGDLAAENGARVIYGSWEGYAATKNKANAAASFDWILSLDADEELSEELREAILVWKAGVPVHASFTRLTNYCGKFIRHCGWYPEYKWRLFNRTNAFWTGTIHEHLTTIQGISSPVVRLKGNCFHYSYYTTDEHINQSDTFAKLAANDFFNQGKRSSLLRYAVGPVIKFCTMYFVKLGFLDGRAGYLVCKISADAYRLREKYLHQLSA